MDNNEIRVKVNGGYLVAGRSPDPNYDGIYVQFETDDGLPADIVVVEAPTKYGKKKIVAYTYEDAVSEDWTTKFTLDTQEICDSFKI